jgi:hypothetical protein
MNKHKVLFVVFLFCIGGLAAHSQSSPIVVEIKPTQTVVKDNETFSVSTTLRNRSSEVQVLGVMSCSYPAQWAVDNLSVYMSQVSCLRNVLSRIILKPGEAYERTLSVHVELASGKGQLESVTFRLGFQDENPLTVPKAPRIWSNAVTVSVTR